MWRRMVTIDNAVAALNIRILKTKTLAQAGHDAALPCTAVRHLEALLCTSGVLFSLFAAG